MRDGELAIEAARSETYEIVLLDMGLPLVDGLDVLKKLRAGACR
ncbi:DNA-binding response OmpR family regulator [Bradyrhizobium sp. F1.13.1]